MTPSLKVALCTTVKNRCAHLRTTLPRNLADNDGYENCVFVVLDYSSTDGLQEYLKAEHAASMAAGRLVIYHDRGEPRFRMAHAKNMAQRCGILEGADVLVNLDADNYTGPGFARHVAEQFELGRDRIFLFAHMIREVLPRGISGRIATTRAAFLHLGGYDERFDTWGADDRDYNLRLRRSGREGLALPLKNLDGILHNDRLRFREYPQAQSRDDSSDKSLTLEGSDATVVNFGHVGCGTVYRNFGEVPITLEPFPTRIFGIGMHKTGTTSLHQALGLLGYASAHWPSAHWAKAVWEEIQAGRSRTLERHYAATDLPIGLLYSELDAAYPGSKFILTTRNPDSWLKSVQAHWDAAINPFRAQWDSDPFTHKLHRLVYGRKGFDPQVFLNRYLQHNAEVLEHFGSRQDLLVLSLEARNPWKKLCGFLGQPVPTVPYPRANWVPRP